MTAPLRVLAAGPDYLTCPACRALLPLYRVDPPKPPVRRRATACQVCGTWRWAPVTR